MEQSSKTTGKLADSYSGEAAFEQLLRLASSYASSRTAAAQGGSHSAVRKSPMTDDIERRAYHLYLGRGATHGHDLDDWLEAERQVLEGIKKNKASLRLALAFGLLKESAGR
jgi:hypothetical protein